MKRPRSLLGAVELSAEDGAEIAARQRNPRSFVLAQAKRLTNDELLGLIRTRAKDDRQFVQELEKEVKRWRASWSRKGRPGHIAAGDVEIVKRALHLLDVILDQIAQATGKDREDIKDSLLRRLRRTK